MRPLSSFRLPDEQKPEFQDTVEGIRTDYERFSFEDEKEIISLMSEITNMRLDNDNGSTGYIDGGLIQRVRSPRGIGYQYIVCLDGIGPIPIFYLELYTKDNRLGNSYGRIDFYGAFYHFHYQLENVNHFAIELYKHILMKEIKRTRVDIAVDFKMSFPENAQEFFYPPGNQKRGIRSFHDNNGKLNSVCYLPKRNKGYGVRIYNKTFDTKKKGKEAWYPTEWHKNEHTRIEYEFYPPYSDKFDNEKLIQLIEEKLLEGKKVTLGFAYEKLEFNIQNAYQHFEKYAKNHGISIDQLLAELLIFHAQKKSETNANANTEEKTKEINVFRA